MRVAVGGRGNLGGRGNIGGRGLLDSFGDLRGGVFLGLGIGDLRACRGPSRGVVGVG